MSRFSNVLTSPCDWRPYLPIVPTNYLYLGLYGQPQKPEVSSIQTSFLNPNPPVFIFLFQFLTSIFRKLNVLVVKVEKSVEIILSVSIRGVLKSCLFVCVRILLSSKVNCKTSTWTTHIKKKVFLLMSCTWV